LGAVICIVGPRGNNAVPPKRFLGSDRQPFRAC
jgi:hypothetical protein